MSKTFSGPQSTAFWSAINRVEPTPGVLYEYGCKAQEMEAEVARLQVLVDRVPKTADGVCALDGMAVLFWSYDGTKLFQDHIEYLRKWPEEDWYAHFSRYTPRPLSKCYSTRAAAEAAAEEASDA